MAQPGSLNSETPAADRRNALIVFRRLAWDVCQVEREPRLRLAECSADEVCLNVRREPSFVSLGQELPELSYALSWTPTAFLIAVGY